MNYSHEEVAEANAEVLRYTEEALTENKNGYPEIATYWEKAARAAALVAETSSVPGKIHHLETFPRILEVKEKFSISQLSIHYFNNATKAMRSGDATLAQHYIGAAERFKKATHFYEHWTTRGHQESIKAHTVHAQEALEMVKIYRDKQAEAERDHRLSQQWAEAACLAQEAAHRAKKTATLFANKENPSLAHAVLMAAYSAKAAALWRADVAGFLSMRKKKEARRATRIALASEHAATYRSKASKTISLPDKTISHYWTMAAYWAATSAHYQQQHDLIFKKVSRMAEKVSHAYAQAAKNKSTRTSFAFIFNFWLKQASRAEKKVEATLQLPLSFFKML